MSNLQVCSLLAGLLVAACALLATITAYAQPRPVILDTDIGSDIDDTWALAMLLGTPELDVKLIVTDYGNTPERTRLVAKILERLGRTDIPIGTGIKTNDEPLAQRRWAGDFDLAAYPGKVYEDGVAALIDTIHAHPGITLICIGPVPNIKEALRRDPEIARKAHIVCTGGRIYRGFENGGMPPGDWNVRADVVSWRAMVAAPWSITTSPLDASAEIVLRGDRYAAIARSQHPLARIVIENYESWEYRKQYPEDASSVLFDTAAIYLAYSEEFARIEPLKLIVDDEGHTRISEDGKEIRCQLGWKDRESFDDVIVRSLTSSGRVAPSTELIQEVMAGKRQEARASWWGFDPEDSTKFLQAAINSKVKRLIIDRQASPWITRPLSGVSNQEIVLEAGTELIALKGAFRGKGECLLSFRECENVVLRGERTEGGQPARIRMHKSDYQSSAYERSEWRHGVAFYGCRKVLVEDLVLEQTGGDGIYLGAGSNHRPNRNVTIRRVDCNENHRQGISVISAEDLLIEDCRLRNTRGTAPAAGIDFEPNDPEDRLVRCVLRRCVAENNAGTGFQICPQFLMSQSEPISIHLDQCVSRNNRQHAVHLVSNPNDPPVGQLRITGLVAESDGMAGLSVQFNPFDAVRIELEDSVFRGCALGAERFFPPLYVQGLDSPGRPAGNLHIRDLIVEDNVDRSILKIRDRRGNGVQAVTGNIRLERNGRSEMIEIDEEWLKEMRE